jgi:hypothetical protein
MACVSLPLEAHVIVATVFRLVDLHPTDERLSTHAMKTRARRGANGNSCVIPWVETPAAWTAT